jgi:hypothetical protein
LSAVVWGIDVFNTILIINEVLDGAVQFFVSCMDARLPIVQLLDYEVKYWG